MDSDQAPDVEAPAAPVPTIQGVRIERGMDFGLLDWSKILKPKIYVLPDEEDEDH